MSHIIYGLAILVVFLLNACYAPRNITLQVLTSPDTMLFSQESDLLLMNTMFGDTDLEDTLTFDELRLPATVYNQLSWKVLYGFADIASESPWVKTVLFDSVRLINVPPSVYHNIQAKHAMEHHSSISVRLDSLVFGDSLVKKPTLSIDGSSSLSLLQVNLFLKLGTYWDIYRQGEGTYTLEVLDTFNLEGAGLTQAEAIANLPDIRENIYDLTYHAGGKSAFKIFPTWESVSRIYYIHQTNKKMVQAEQSAKKNDWFAAAGIWNDLTTSKNKSLAAHAAFNMAVVAEMNDMLDIAEYWLVKSYQLKPDKVTKEYLDLIRTREKEKSEILK